MYVNCHVLDGMFKGKQIGGYLDNVYIVLEKVGMFGSKRLYLNNDTVSEYKLVNRTESERLKIKGSDRDTIYNSPFGRRVSNASVEKKVTSENTVLITFKDGNQSLIVIDGSQYAALEKNCKFGINLNRYENNNDVDNVFNINKEFICPHCNQIYYGAAGKYCPSCKRSLSEPPRKKLLTKKQMGIAALIYFVILIIAGNIPFMNGTLAGILISVTVILFIIYLAFILPIKVLKEKKENKKNKEK